MKDGVIYNETCSLLEGKVKSNEEDIQRSLVQANTEDEEDKTAATGMRKIFSKRNSWRKVERRMGLRGEREHDGRFEVSDFILSLERWCWQDVHTSV
jgi:hypothetical protein